MGLTLINIGKVGAESIDGLQHGRPVDIIHELTCPLKAIAVSASFSGTAQLPPTESLKEAYQNRVTAKGHGRSFHSLKGEEVEYVQEIIAWVNAGRASIRRYGDMTDTIGR